MKRFGVAAFFVFTLGFSGASPVTAACSAPILAVITNEQVVHPGSVITIEGLGFGDNCYDSSPPPSGEGTFGMPQHSIDIVLVQNGLEHLVASGNAGAAYDFSVDIVVPSDVEVGAMSVTANLPAQGAMGDRSVFAGQEIQVVAGEASVPIAVSRFGPAEPAQPWIDGTWYRDSNSGQSDSSSLFDDSTWLWWALGMLVVGFIAGRKLPRSSDGCS